MSDFDSLKSSIFDVREKVRGLSDDLACLSGDLDDVAIEQSGAASNLLEIIEGAGLPTDEAGLREELSYLSRITEREGSLADAADSLSEWYEVRDRTGHGESDRVSELVELGESFEDADIYSPDDVQDVISSWDRVVNAFGEDDVDDICKAIDLCYAIQHEFNLRGHEVLNSEGELQVGKILDNEGSDEVISSMKSLVAALRKAGVLDGTVSVPALPENGAPPVQQATPESASEATTNN